MQASLDAGGDVTCAIKGGGQLYCRGDSLHGQLGTVTAARVQPTLEIEPPASSAGGVPAFSFDLVDVGRHHACAMDGSQLFCWGEFGFGVFGENSTSVELEPIAVTLP